MLSEEIAETLKLLSHNENTSYANRGLANFRKKFNIGELKMKRMEKTPVIPNPLGDGVHIVANAADSIQQSSSKKIDEKHCTKAAIAADSIQHTSSKTIDEKDLKRERSRQHARNTRARKKARYEDLIEKESKFLEIVRDKEENDILVDNLMIFMDARTKNITELTSNISHIDRDYTESRPTIYDTVTDTSCFTFEAIPHARPSTGKGLVDLQVHDIDFIIQIMSKFATMAGLSLKFHVKKETISISPRKCAYFEFTMQLIFAYSEEVMSIHSGIMKIQFADNYHKIISMTEIITQNWLPMLKTFRKEEDISGPSIK